MGVRARAPFPSGSRTDTKEVDATMFVVKCQWLGDGAASLGVLAQWPPDECATTEDIIPSQTRELVFPEH
ncbi:hypothetical protein NDU88_008053 [Pleurodeles waltl]|uniref:Uncharacterized protein n=1 Tax=Pleurodeles waltl TaxID=8319 RepID=A0AAV7VVI9_PLEWA|nr:hypothetical protein NDU88_008053 [Pleurodeles waltl]